MRMIINFAFIPPVKGAGGNHAPVWKQDTPDEWPKRLFVPQKFASLTPSLFTLLKTMPFHDPVVIHVV